MTVILAGNAAFGRDVEAALQTAGFEFTYAETPEALKALPENQPVILLGRSRLDRFLSDDIYARTTVAPLPPRAPVVLLLDLEADSPDYVFRLALQRALALAEAKRPPILLARSMRSGLPGTEKLYTDARTAGVTFIKYEKITINRGSEVCELTVNDGNADLVIETPLLIDCSLKDDKEWMKFAEALRLHTYGGGLLNADRWFLDYGQTSRRGIFFIDTGVKLSGALKKTLAAIINAIGRLSDKPHGLYAQVDAQKCAFCYTCYRVCPHGAPVPDGTAPAMKIVASSCEGCGICAAICPGNAIEMREPEETKDTDGGHERVIAFCCENSAAIAAKTVFSGMDIEQVVITCGGQLSIEKIISALLTHDRVLIAVCAEEACKHFDGGSRAQLQAEKARQRLEKLQLDPTRVEVVRISHAMPLVLKNAAEALLEDGGRHL